MHSGPELLTPAWENSFNRGALKATISVKGDDDDDDSVVCLQKGVRWDKRMGKREKRGGKLWGDGRGRGVVLFGITVELSSAPQLGHP